MIYWYLKKCTLGVKQQSMTHSQRKDWKLNIKDEDNLKNVRQFSYYNEYKPKSCLKIKTSVIQIKIMHFELSMKDTLWHSYL
jgi:hypothetical protein